MHREMIGDSHTRSLCDNKILDLYPFIYLAVSNMWKVTGGHVCLGMLKKSSILCDLEAASMGPNGVIHLVAALGYDWAIRPIIIADAHGWTNTAAGTSNLPAITKPQGIPFVWPLVLMPCRELVQVQLPSASSLDVMQSITDILFDKQPYLSLFLIPIFGDMEIYFVNELKHIILFDEEVLLLLQLMLQYVWEAEAEDSSYVIKEQTYPEKVLTRGTQTTLYLRDDDKYEFTDPARIESLVKNCSQFVSFPIYTWKEKSRTFG
ncbi:hypothetical protein ACJX0J_039200, partial [Zea mays]